MMGRLSLITYDSKSDITIPADIDIPAVTKTTDLFVSKLDVPFFNMMKPDLVLRKQVKRQSKEHQKGL